MSIAWFPGIERLAGLAYLNCSVCNEVRLVLAGIGLGMQAQGRFEVVQMDDAKLSELLALKTGYVSILVLTCVCTGAVVYLPRKEMVCVSTAFHIFIGWVKENCWFKILKSDSDPAYASALISTLLSIAGTKDGISHEYNSLGHHCCNAEQPIRLLRKVLDQAERYDDCVCARDLEVYVAACQIEANQVAVSDGSTVFERTRGTKAVTTKELMSYRTLSDSDYAKAVKKMKTSERKMIELLRVRCDHIMAERRIQQEKRAEHNSIYGRRNVEI